MAEPEGLAARVADGKTGQRLVASGVTQNKEAWEAQTQTHLKSVRALREELLDTCRGLASDPQPCGRNVRALEDRLKQRAANQHHVATALANQMDSMKHTSYRVGRCLVDLQRGSAALWNSANIAEKRLELRAKRPPQELVQDHFQDALELERVELLEAHRQLATQMKSGQDVRDAVEGAKAEMHQHKLTLHLDRTRWPQELLGRMCRQEEAALQFCEAAGEALRRSEDVSAKTQKATTASMKQRIAELLDMRRQLESEIHETRYVLAKGERELERMRKATKEQQAAPEARLRDDGPPAPDAPWSRGAALDPAAVAKLRAAIKAAAYTGHAGRQLEALFGRFDRDGSGELHEDEVRRALRRTLKISPSVVSDPEISALCTMLDADDSGSVSIKEIVEFLSPDVDLKTLEEEYQKKRVVYDQLTAALHEMVENLRCKAAAWKIDDSCLKVTPIKGLELDTLPSLCRGSEQTPKRKKPLEPRVVEKVRSKINKAAHVHGDGRQFEDLFCRLDKNGSGLLDDDELRLALRRTLKIPSYAVSDAEISSLFAMLDADHSGTVSVGEIVDFVGPAPERLPPHAACTPVLEPLDAAGADGAPQPGGPSPASPAHQGPPLHLPKHALQARS